MCHVKGVVTFQKNVDILSIFSHYIECRPETPPLPATSGDVAQV